MRLLVLARAVFMLIAQADVKNEYQIAIPGCEGFDLQCLGSTRFNGNYFQPFSSHFDDFIGRSFT